MLLVLSSFPVDRPMASMMPSRCLSTVSAKASAPGTPL